MNSTMDKEVESHQDDLFVVMWGSHGEEMAVNTLVYRGRDGGVRTYREGRLDARAGDEHAMPRFSDKMWALEWMHANRGEKCLVTVRAAKVMREGGDHFCAPMELPAVAP